MSELADIPSLVLLPGLDGTGALFARFTESLGATVATQVLSYPTDLALGYAELEARVRTALPQDRVFFLLAESFSGPIALSIAASPPAGLLGVILCCSFAKNPLPLLRHASPLLHMLPMKATPRWVLELLLLEHRHDRQLSEDLQTALQSVAGKVIRKRLKEVLTVDLSGSLRDIKLPLLYLRAAEDRLVTKSAAHFICHAIPHCELHSLSAPHFLLQTQPEAAASCVSAFMQRVARQTTNTSFTDNRP